MEEKDSATSGPYEEFRICFCGENIRSGYVEWYVIDVSVEEACLSEKTESGTRELTPFSVTKHLPSYAALDGLIYSLGGQRRSVRGGDTLLNDVWLLDFKSLEDLKPGSGKAPDSDKAQAQAQSPRAVRGGDCACGYALSESGALLENDDLLEKDAQDFIKALLEIGKVPSSGKAQAQAQSPRAVMEPELVPGPKLVSGNSQSGEYWKPDSDKASLTPLTAPTVEDWKPGLPMNFARYNPHTMVVDHKLYVLGGFLPNQNQAVGWIEVFDPEEKKWESLPSPSDQIHSSIMISGLLESKKEIIIAKHRWDFHPLLFYSYNITTRCWNKLSLHSDSEASVHSNVERTVIRPPNIGRAVTVGNTLYWISTEEHNHECIISAYDLVSKMWFEDRLNTATIFGRRERFSSIYSRGPGFLHLVDQKFCLLLQSSVPKKDPQSSIEYLYCVILDISPIYEHEHEDWGKFELKTVSVQKYSMDHYIDFLDCMLL